jgi:hypothetical protein
MLVEQNALKWNFLLLVMAVLAAVWQYIIVIIIITIGF